MNYEIQFGTDTATLGVFDPDVLKHRLEDKCGWWCDDLSDVEEVKRGKITLVSLGGDGVYKVRLTDGPLSPDEESYAVARLPTLGLDVQSGHVFVGPAEYLPGEGSECSPDDEVGKCFFVKIPLGLYDLDVFGINWHDSSQWYVAPGSPVPVNAPVDLVLVLRPRTGEFQAPSEKPRFDGIEDEWLFPDKPRQLGPMPGMVLTVTVVQRRDELVLREAGPLDYRPILSDMGNLQRKDMIQVSVLSVDHDSKTMQVQRV